MLQKLNLKNRNLIPVALILVYILWLLFSDIFKSTTVATVVSPKDYLIPVLVLMYALSVNVEHKAKQYLLPVAFGIRILFYILSIILNILRVGVSEYFGAFFVSIPNAVSFIGGTAISLVTLLLMIFGTIRNFKHPELFKIGATILVAIAAISLVGGTAVRLITYRDYLQFNFSVIDYMVRSVLSSIATLLYQIAILLLAKDMCKEKKAVN